MHFGVFFLVSLLLAQSILCDDQVKNDPVLNYLNIHPHTVETHDLAQIYVDRRDNATALGFRVFGQDINLWLHPVDSILFTDETPVYKGRASSDGIKYTLFKNVMKRVGQAFENKDHLASIVIGTEVNRSTVNGHMVWRRDNLVIRSLPNDVVKEYLRKRRSAEIPVEPHSNMAHHVAIKLKEPLARKIEINEVPPLTSKHLEKLSRMDLGQAYPDRTNNTLYPEILVFVDYSYKKDWGGNKFERLVPFMEYLMAFWNGVDLIYRNIEVPRIRLNIAAIVLNLNAGSTPYMHQVNNVIQTNSSLNDAALFFYQYQNFNGHEWDIAVTMTKFSLVNEGAEEAGSEVVIGISYQESVCERYALYGAVAQAIIHDNGAFFGIPVGAHEIVHTLGVEHDNVTTHQKCDTWKGFLMAPVVSGTNNSHSLSVCSLAQIQDMQSKGHFECLTNKPLEKGRKLLSPMPGKIVSLDEQCRAFDKGFKSACQPNTRSINVCARLWCKRSSGSCHPIRMSVADGTACIHPNGNAKGFCLQNACTVIDQ